MQSEELGKKLRDFRKKKGYSLQKLGALLGLSPQAISQYELNKRDIPSLTLGTIFLVLGIRGKELISLLESLNDIDQEEKVSFMRYFVDSFPDPAHEPITESKDKAWYFIENALRRIGYSVKGDPAEGYLWLESAEGSFEVTEEELLRLSKESAEFLKFKVDQLSKGKQIKSKK